MHHFCKVKIVGSNPTYSTNLLNGTVDQLEGVVSLKTRIVQVQILSVLPILRYIQQQKFYAKENKCILYLMGMWTKVKLEETSCLKREVLVSSNLTMPTKFYGS